MGAVNKIPGVSGGTVAFVTGIYEDLINSIKKIFLVLEAFIILLRMKSLLITIVLLLNVITLLNKQEKALN